MKLVGLEKIWWPGIEGDIRRLEQPPTSTRQEIKANLHQKYIQANFMISCVN